MSAGGVAGISDDPYTHRGDVRSANELYCA